MPRNRRQTITEGAALSKAGRRLRVFSVDHPEDEAHALEMAKLLGAIALEQTAREQGLPGPHLAGIHKLADVRARTAAPHSSTDDPEEALSA